MVTSQPKWAWRGESCRQGKESHAVPRAEQSWVRGDSSFSGGGGCCPPQQSVLIGLPSPSSSLVSLVSFQVAAGASQPQDKGGGGERGVIFLCLALGWHLGTWRRSSCNPAPQSLTHGLEQGQGRGTESIFFLSRGNGCHCSI